MLFPSIPFLYFFLPLTLILYAAVPKKLKNALLFLASLVFYAWGEQSLVIIFLLAMAAGWVLGLAIEKKRCSSWSKPLLVLSCVLFLGMLGYFKYTDFFIAQFNAVTGLSVPFLRIALPIGISFYTFQILSYIVDVYRGSVKAQRSFIDLAAYISFFPQLIAGPIVRYSDIEAQLAFREHDAASAAEGTRRFIIGLSKKVLLANPLGELCHSFQSCEQLSVLFCWLYGIAFMLQIYFDFSGYSDMAIGLARLFGFRLTENFNYPYVSTSITEFWRRWHISLGSWFRDYVYIPLGGNRRGRVRQIFNILVVWTLTGFWHGAAWNFIFWGMLYAVLLIFEKLWLKEKLDAMPALGHIYVLFTVMLGFILFNAADLADALRCIKGLFAFSALPLATPEALYCLRSYAVILALSVIGATELPKRIYVRLAELRTFNLLEPFVLCALLITVTAYLIDGSFNPFLYFRF